MKRGSWKHWFARMLHRVKFCPRCIWIEWISVGPMYPDRIVDADTIPRNVEVRKQITNLLGTKDWVWIGPKEIRAYYKRIIPPRGGSGTTPAKNPRND